MLAPHQLLVAILLASLLSLTVAAESDPSLSTQDLPECEFDTEVQFYTADIDVLQLPEACSEGFHLSTIGFILQDVVSDVEERMPKYKEEESNTLVCPFPDEVQDEHGTRRLELLTTYRYRASGRCRRCGTYYDRLRKLQTNSVCSISKSTNRLRDEVEYAANAAWDILQAMNTKVKSEALLGEQPAKAILTKANAYYQECHTESLVASKASKAAEELCVSSSGMRSSAYSFACKVEMERQAALVSKAKSNKALNRIRSALRDLDILIYIRTIKNRRNQHSNFQQEQRFLQEERFAATNKRQKISNGKPKTFAKNLKMLQMLSRILQGTSTLVAFGNHTMMPMQKWRNVINKSR